MILKASQRGGPLQLADHLLNDDENENDHVTLYELSGFVSSDLRGAMQEVVAIAKGTRCRQPIFSMSINPPQEAVVEIDILIEAADRAGKAIGLESHPRAIVIHEKKGRRHAHVVWSRIDAEQMTALNLPFFKTKLNGLSKELYLENGWELPDGYRENGWKNPLNFTLAEWQQARRHDLDPREIKQLFQTTYQQADSLKAFSGGLEDRGFFLARGDRRGFVAIDLNGEVYSVARFAGLKAKDLSARFGSPDTLPDVAQTKDRLKKLKNLKVQALLAAEKKYRKDAEKPLREQLRMLVSHHRKERATLNDKQSARRVAESQVRAGRFRRGLGAIADILTGRLFAQRKENEQEALEHARRDRIQRETLVRQQIEERRELMRRQDALREQLHEARAAAIRKAVLFARSMNVRGPERQNSL